MVTCDSHLRRVTHYHYTSWPDFGSPATDSFLEMARAVGQTSKDKPIIVHCSAGLGRSGVFITVHTALECFRDKRKVDIKDIASKIRNQREGMIQSQDQYRFCLEAVANELAPEVAVEEQGSTMRATEPLPPQQLREGHFTSPVMFVPDSSQSPLVPTTPTTPRRNGDVTEESGGPSPSVATPPPPPSSTTTTTPSQRASPPPPSSSPPPPISEPQTPLKAPLPSTSPSTPEITYTPPTPRMSREESNRELIQRKLDSMASERDKEEQRQLNEEATIVKEEQTGGKERTEKERPPAVAAAVRDSVASIAQRTPIVKPEPTERSSPEETRPAKVKEQPTQEPPSIQPPVLEKKDGQKDLDEPKTSKEEASQKDEKEQPKPKDKAETPKEAQELPPKVEVKGKRDTIKTSKEAAKPPTKKEVEVKKDKPAALPVKSKPEAKVEEDEKEGSEKEEEEEEGGFSIGDDLLDFKPPPKKSLKDEKQPKPSSQPSWRYPKKPAPSIPPSAPKKPAPSPPPSTHTPSEPAPAKKKRPQTPKLRPREAMRSEPEVYSKAVKKLVIPAIFGGAAAQSPADSPQPSPKTSPKRFGQPIADTTKRENEPQLSPARKPPAFGQRVLPVVSPRPPTQSHTEEKESATADTKAPGDEGRQMNVLDRIKLLEGQKKPTTTSTPTPTYKLPMLPQKATWSTGSTTSASSKPAYKLPQKQATIKPVKPDIPESKPSETTTTSTTSTAKEETSSKAEPSSSDASASSGNVARLLARFQQS